MRTLQPLIKMLLGKTGIPVAYQYPAAWAKTPCITWYEANNRELAQAGAREDLTELAYVVDIWASSPEELVDVAMLVDAQMASSRIRRTFAQDLFEPKADLHHKTMRYRAVVDEDGRIYQ